VTTIVTPGSSGRVVLSHAPMDEQLATSMCTGLEERGVRCWLASRDAPAGIAGVEAHAAALEDATAILVLVSTWANESAEVRRDLEVAFSSRSPLLALSADGAAPEGPLRYYLGDSRRFELGDDPGALLDELATALGRFLRAEELPRPATALIGRSRELTELVGLLHGPSARLLTLTGPGGTGKTRLALEAARALAPVFEDGAVWVSLAPLRDPSLSLSTIAQTLAVDEQPGRDLLDTFADALAGHDLLLVLDNAEHLLPELAKDVSTLSARCPSLRLLVTSRERLDVRGELAYPVPALQVDDAAELFLSRARQVGAELHPSDTVSELCRRLDRLPLALELAAARSVLFTPAQLLERLSERLDLLKGARDADPRQQTLRAAIDWSYDLLEAEEQRVFRSLSVFAGGCTYEATEAVTDATADLLQSLIEKSLLHTGETPLGRRYWMLETIRQYAAEKLLAASGEQKAVRDRHARWLVRLMEEAKRHDRDAEVGRWTQLVRLELDNVRAALEHLHDHGDADLEIHTMRTVVGYASGAGFVPAVAPLAERALERADASPEARFRALDWGATAALQTGRIDDARARAREAAALAVELADRGLEARALDNLSFIESVGGDLEAAERAVRLGLELATSVGDPVLEASVRGNLANVLLQQGRGSEAVRHLELAYEAFRSSGDHGGAAWVRANQGLAALADGRPADAAPFLFDVISVGVPAEDWASVAGAVEFLGVALARRGFVREATQLLSCAKALREESGTELEGLERRLHDEALARVEAELAPDELQALQSAGAALSVSEAVDLARRALDS
jgi:predicted ATPase